MSKLLENVVAIAAAEVGVTEEPPGSNQGKRVNEYLLSVGLGPGFSWCAAFIVWVYKRAYAGQLAGCPIVPTGGVMDHYRRAPAKAKITAAQARANPALVRPGVIGILLLDKHTGAGHTYIVTGRNGVNLETVEGNTAPASAANAGTREGVGVFRLNRRKLTDKILVGFIDYTLV